MIWARLGARVESRGTLRRTGIVWGLADQSLSSLTNFALAVLAARRLGPADLGIVSIGFSSYVITLMLLRALVTDPAIVSASAPAVDRDHAVRSSITVTIAAGAGIALIFAVSGWMLGGAIGQGLLLFAPWIVPALVQDFWRFALFSAGRRGSAVLNDGVWVIVMSATLPFAWRSTGPWAIVSCWGLGATVASLVGVLQTRAVPGHVRASLRWWRREGASLGGWLAVETAFLALGSHGAVFLLALLISPAELGGLRAVQSIFAPLTLIGPAITLPGLPAITSALRQSPTDARAMATRLNLAALGLTGAYIAAFLVAPGRLLGLVYGDGFSQFADLVGPVAVAQLAHAAAVGYILLLKGGRRARVLALARAAGTVVALTLAGFLAGRHGVVGAAWGLAFGVVVSMLLIMLSSRRTLSVGAPTDTPVSSTVSLIPPGSAAAGRDWGGPGES